MSTATVRVKQAAIRLAICATLALGGLLGMSNKAEAAVPFCWVQGAYMNPVPGSWNSYYHHKVVCNMPTNAVVHLFRNGVIVTHYTQGANDQVPGGYRNWAYQNWPMYCGSTYQVRVGVVAQSNPTSAVQYWGPSQRFC